MVPDDTSNEGHNILFIFDAVALLALRIPENGAKAEAPVLGAMHQFLLQYFHGISWGLRIRPFGSRDQVFVNGDGHPTLVRVMGNAAKGQVVFIGKRKPEAETGIRLRIFFRVGAARVFMKGSGSECLQVFLVRGIVQ